MIGRSLGHFQILKPLGRGGMGQVYQARDLELERDVAIKLLTESLGSDPTAMVRLGREAKLLAALNHPTIATIHSLEEVDGERFLVLELVTGRTLEELLRDGPLRLEEALLVSAQVAEALEEAHAGGIVHRDLKPANVMVTEHRQVKVLDFGLAKIIRPQPAAGVTGAPTASEVLTSAGAIPGTAPYVSPEQIRGGAVDKRADIWAFGCLLYETLSGRRAFAAATFADTLAAVLERQPDWEALPEATPPRVRSLLTRCLHKEPRQRLHDIADARIEIAEALGASGLGAAPGSAAIGAPPSVAVTTGVDTRVARQAWRRFRWPLAVAAVLMVALAGVNAAGLLDRLLGRSVLPATSPNAAPFIRSLAVMPFEALSDVEEQRSIADALTSWLTSELGVIFAPMKVTPFDSAREAWMRHSELSEVARELGVDGILTGQVIYAGTRPVVVVTLYRASSSVAVWNGRYTPESGDMLALIGNVAGAIAREIELEPAPNSLVRRAQAPALDPEAERAYLLGRHFAEARTAREVDRAADYFRKAIELEPRFALAHAALGNTYIIRASWMFGSPREYYPLGQAEERKALELDDRLPEAHGNLGWILGHGQWRWEAGEAALRRSIRLNDSYAAGHQWLGQHLTVVGRVEEGLLELRRAVQIAPLSLATRYNFATALEIARRPDEALEQWQRAFEQDPDYVGTRVLLSVNYARRAMPDRALATIQPMVDSLPDAAAVLACFGVVHALAGRDRVAVGAVDTIRGLSEEGRFIDAGMVAWVHAARGDRAATLEWLERAYEQHAEMLLYTGFPEFDFVRNEPRFRAVRRGMGL